MRFKRRQLFEFHDFSWYPHPLRELQIEVLNLANLLTGFTNAIAGPYSDAIRMSEAKTVLDLCSGAGGPAVQVQASLETLYGSSFELPRLQLSDLYPNHGKWEHLTRRHPRWLDCVREPVDARAIPDSVEGDLVTIINALHHFPIDIVEDIIREVTRRGASLFVAEAFPRNIARASIYIPSLFRALPQGLLQTRGSRLTKLVATATFLPIVGGWDWLASALRIHEPAELLAVAQQLAPHYLWSHGDVPFSHWGKAVFLQGIAP